MFKNIIRAFLICRLELRQLPLDLDLVFASWLRRPAIQILLEEEDEQNHDREHLLHKLDEVYPF